MKRILFFILIVFTFYSCDSLENLKKNSKEEAIKSAKQAIEDINVDIEDGKFINKIDDIVFIDGSIFNYDSLYKYCNEGFLSFKEVKGKDRIVSDEELDFCVCYFNKIASTMTKDEFVQLGRKTKLYSGNDHNEAAEILLDETREFVEDCIYEISIDTMSSSFKNQSYFVEEHDYVKLKMNNWNIKGEFEKTQDYENRLITKSSMMKNEFLDEFIDNELSNYYSNFTYIEAADFRVGKYRADQEYFPIMFEYTKNNKNSFYWEKKLSVPIAEAKFFKELFNTNLKFQPIEEIINIDSIEHLYYNKFKGNYFLENANKVDILEEIDKKNNGFFLDILPVYNNHQIHILEMTFYYISYNVPRNFYKYTYYGGAERRVYNVDSKNSERSLNDIFSNRNLKSWKYVNKGISFD